MSEPIANTARLNREIGVQEQATIVVSVAKAGHLNQCLAFCQQIGWPVADTLLLIPGPNRMNSWVKNLSLRFRRGLKHRWLTPRRVQYRRLRIVASGLSAGPLVASYRSLYGGSLYAVYIGSPRWRETIFDFAVVSHHAVERGETPASTRYPGAAAVAWMAGAFVRSLPSGGTSESQPRVVALIGGANKAFQLRADLVIEQLSQLCSGAGAAMAHAVVVLSRRTPHQLEQELRSALTARGASFVGSSDRQGFCAAVAAASHLAVTPDSITMICECFATGKPVFIFDLPVFNEDCSTFRFVSEVRSFPADRVGSILEEGARAALTAVADDYGRWSER